MARPRVFVTRRVDQEALGLLASEADIEVWEDDAAPPREVMLEKAAGVDGIFTTNEDNIDDALLSKGRDRLRVVANMAVGYDNFDVPAATRLGVAMSNTPGVLTKTTAELGFALMLAVARQVVLGDRETRQGKWKYWHPSLYMGYDLAESTLCMIGMGKIGLEVAKRALAFEMRVVYHNRSRRDDAGDEFEYCASLREALAEADFVCISTPLTSETHHLIGEDELRLMQSNAILVNIARGPVVDNMALYEAVRDGVIAGAGLDVTEPEPIPSDHPLLTLPNVVITPHIGSSTVRTRRAMAVLAARNIVARLRGEAMPNCVNPEVV